jgi:hypothetical protein
MLEHDPAEPVIVWCKADAGVPHLVIFEISINPHRGIFESNLLELCKSRIAYCFRYAP